METSTKKTVLITGTSSGIGRATATRLARAGFRVFAGVRKDADAAALRAEHPAIEPVTIDVTDEASIERARRAVATTGLDGLVNNAGVGISGPLEHVTPDVLRRQFDVDVFGQIAVIQAFLPMIRRSRGRIVNIGSVGSHVSIPFGGVLCGAKAALAAMNDALRLELRPFGISVCLIEPGAIATPAADKMLGDVEATIRELPPDGQTRYGAMLREFTRRAYEQERAGSPPDVVAAAVEQALTAEHPRARYPVGKNARIMTALPRLLPDGALDLIRVRLFGLPRGAV